MPPEGMLSVFVPVGLWREVAFTLDQIYPGEVFASGFEGGQFWYTLPASFPVGSVYMQLSVLVEYGASVYWSSRDVVQSDNYCLQNGQRIF